MRAQLAQVALAVGAAVERRGEAGFEPPDMLRDTARLLIEAHPQPGGPSGDDPGTAGANPGWSTDAVRWSEMATVFDLGPLHQVVLAVAVSAGVDPNFALAYGLLSGRNQPSAPSVTTVLELGGVPRLSADRNLVGVCADLVTHGLLETDAAQPFTSRTIWAPDRVLAHLVGDDTPNPIAARAAISPVPTTFAATPDLAARIQSGHTINYVQSGPGAAGVALAAGALASLEMRSSAVDLGLVPELERMDCLGAALQDAALSRCALIVVAPTDAPGIPHLLAAMTSAPIPIVLVGGHPWDARWLPYLPPVTVAEPLSDAARITMWRSFTKEEPGIAESEPPAFHLTPEQIRDVAHRTISDAVETGAAATPKALRETASAVAANGIRPPGLSRSRPAVGFSDLILDPETARQLRELTSQFAAAQHIIDGSDFLARSSHGRGLAALFTGPPGTGKTLAAQAISAELERELLTVDLAAVVDKYIGETEKNLERAFLLAEITGSVLFFDEADALFGSRSKVTDARDKYANQETAWLLQRLERFDGIALLATNLRANLDRAFTRRLAFVIHFDQPDPAMRAALWAQHLSGTVPHDPSDPPDLDVFARAAELTGGEIRNVTLAASAAAVVDGGLLGSRHLRRALAREFDKLGRRLPAELAAGDLRRNGSTHQQAGLDGVAAMAGGTP